MPTTKQATNQFTNGWRENKLREVWIKRMRGVNKLKCDHWKSVEGVHWSSVGGVNSILAY
jgi:hypothetical protein